MQWNHDETGHANAPCIKFLDGLYSYALVLTRNYADAEDLVQETYVRAMPAMGKLRVDSNIKSWLFTILRNVWLNQRRKPQMFVIEDDVANDIVEPTKDSHDLYVSKIETEQVRAAIQELPVQFREIILLREYEELSYQEIASVLDCPIGTVMSRLGRARAKLRNLTHRVFTTSTRARERGRANSPSPSPEAHLPASVPVSSPTPCSSVDTLCRCP